MPTLVHGDVTLSESLAIVKYLSSVFNATKFYPSEPKARARVEEMSYFLYTDVYRESGYHIVYPLVFPHHKESEESSNEVILHRGKAKLAKHLATIENEFLGKSAWIAGDQPTVADIVAYSVSSFFAETNFATHSSFQSCKFQGYLPPSSRGSGL